MFPEPGPSDSQTAERSGTRPDPPVSRAGRLEVRPRRDIPPSGSLVGTVVVATTTLSVGGRNTVYLPGELPV